MFSNIDKIIEELKKGKIIVVVDDECRENEGDLIMAGQLTTPETINFMAKHGRGLICAPTTAARAEDLGLSLMAAAGNKDKFKTAFTVSVDARKGVSTGISAHDRAGTIRVLSDPKKRSGDIVSPGHVFPLISKNGGVLVRAGHTEAAVDLLTIAGLEPVGVICEIMNDDGTMARLPELVSFCRKHELKICSIAQIIEYRRKSEKLIKRIEATRLPTRYGEFKLIGYESVLDRKEHLAMVMGEPAGEDSILVRVHSECLTGDVLGSLRCDCGRQLDESLKMISGEGTGVLLYMRQEGRGIGLGNKLKCYALQDKGCDTVEANEKMGFKPDLREYGIGAQILVDLGLKRIRLITNNPRKIIGLEGYGIEIKERVPIKVGINKHNERYIRTKKEKLGHLF